MSILIYKFLHLFGVILLFVSLGGLGALALTDQTTSKARSTFVTLHGVGLLIILVAGFGWLAKMGYGLPIWALIKLAIWLAFGALIVPLKRKPALARPLILFVVPALAALTIGIAVWHAQIFGI